MRRCVVLVLLGCAAGAAAQPSVAPSPAASAPDFAQLLLSMAVVLGLILGGAWIVKRFHVLGQRNTGVLRVVASLALGPKERLLFVEAGNRRLLLGVSAAGIVTLDVEGCADGVAEPVDAFARKLDDEVVRQWAVGS